MHPSGTSDQFFFLLEIFFKQLGVWYFLAPSLTGGRVCNLQLLLVLASAVPSGLNPTGLKTIFYCPNSWDSPNLEGQVTVFIPPGNRVAQIYAWALGYILIDQLIMLFGQVLWRCSFSFLCICGLRYSTQYSS
jgi:hypothetical protein